ncbi:MAG: hypothetical protein R2753_06975 [Chitinophagales bacterium]
MKEKKNLLVVLLTGVLFIVIFGYLFFLNLHQHKDILCWDEVLYMWRGLGIPQKIPKGWAPIYGAWYLVEAIGQKIFTEINLVKLYYLNFKILAIAAATLLFVFFTLKKVHPVAAFFIAVGYFISSINLETWPHISHFCVVILMMGMIKSHFFKSWVMKWLIVITTVFLLSYARPEFYLSFLALSVLFIGWLIFQKFQIKKLDWLALLGIGAFVFFVHYKMGGVMFSGNTAVPENGYSRDIFAFGQHFALNYFTWNDIDSDFWLAWEPYFRDNFEVHGSIFSTGMSNQEMFFKHLGSNLGGLFYNTLDEVSGVFFLDKILRFPFWLKISLAIIAIALGLYFGKGLKRNFQHLISSEHGFIVLVFFLFAAPTVVASILIYPRDHYLMLQIPFYISIIAFVFFRTETYVARDTTIGILLIGAFLFMLTPNKSKINYFDLWQNKTVSSNYLAINKLKALDFGSCSSIKEPCMLLENEGGLSIYVENKQLLSTIPETNTNHLAIQDYLDSLNTAIIFVTNSLLKDPILTKVEGWEAFIAAPENAQWKELEIEGTEDYFLVKEGMF